MSLSLDELVKATQLTREGRLKEATQTIRRALAGMPSGPPAYAAPTLPAVEAMSEKVIDVADVAFRDVPPAQTSPSSAPSSPPAAPAPPSSFTEGEYAFGGKSYRYRLFQPSGTEGLRPVVVMLHGCKQDADDFARGTAMNEAAQRHGAMVLYVEQLRSENNMGCWNWFEPAHQARGAGEPAMIASLAQKIVKAHGGDPARVYVAGLSAGGAMALVVAQLYPDVFAATGVHSGLPAGAAGDVVSAFSAMRKGAKHAPAASAAVPAIVFHGTADKTVHPSNAKHIVQGLRTRLEANGRPVAASSEAIPGKGKRGATRTSYTSHEGRAHIEHWELSQGPHAWSGGRVAGSFTDPAGPDASEAMLSFFLKHRLATQGQEAA